jgi:DNA-directed RNA polymerase specialized sigma24 family protein
MMSAGDNTRDDRWRPGFASSERRVREELEDAAEPVVYSRELSFVPAQRRPKFEAHDPQTRALIAEQKRLEALQHGASIAKRLDEWRWIDTMYDGRQKQAHLEPLIHSVQRDPVAHEDVLLFLLIVFEPIRRGVSARFVHAHGGVSRSQPVDWSDRTQARTIREIERQTLYDVTREAVIEAIFRYPAEGARMLFPWFRAVVARHALFQLRKDLTDDSTSLSGAEAEALQSALADLDSAEPPAMRERTALRWWRGRLPLRDLYGTVEDFYRHGTVRRVCSEAIGRLPRVQAEVIDGLFFQQHTPEHLAGLRGCTRSTIYNNQAKATRNMEQDDCFYAALFRLGILRDQTRAEEIRRRYPDGRHPSGRRIVLIDQAA